MSAAVQVSLEEYLSTTYEHDCDYVDGEVIDRGMPDWDHSATQGSLVGYLANRRKQMGIRVHPEQRIRIGPTRTRVVDVCCPDEDAPREPVIVTPPLVCVEILSPDDRFEATTAKIEDYLKICVPCVWVINPRTRHAWIHTSDGSRSVRDGVLRTPDGRIEVPLAELFEA